MGVYLMKPNTNKVAEYGGADSTRFGLASMQGWRKQMEDAHLAIPDLDKDIGLYGVFDGHGGPAVSSWSSRRMAAEFQKNVAEIKRKILNGDLTTDMDIECELLAAINRAPPMDPHVVVLPHSTSNEDESSLLGPTPQSAACTGDDDDDADAPAADVEDAEVIEEEAEDFIHPRSLTLEAVVVCEALQKTFLKLDEMMMLTESRKELKEIHQSQVESEEEYKMPQIIQWYSAGLGRCGTVVRRATFDKDGRPTAQYLILDNPQELLPGDQIICKPPSDEVEGDKDVPTNDFDFLADEVYGGSDDDESNESFESDNANEAHLLATEEEHDTKLLNDESIDNAPTTTTTTTTRSTKKSASRPQQRSEDERMYDAKQQMYLAMEPDFDEYSEGDDHQFPTTNHASKNDDGDDRGTSTVESETPSAGNDDDESADLRMEPFTPECCGSTVIVTAVLGGENPYLITANAGDSRVVLCRGGAAIALSRDHKPNLFKERQRIKAAGGKVIQGRVDGNLNLSRCLGDLLYKNDAGITAEAQRITSFPDIRVIPLDGSDEFAVLACDGIWDCMTNDEVVDFVKARIPAADDVSREAKLSSICEELCDKCLSAHPMRTQGIGCDNMTVMIVEFGDSLKAVVDRSPKTGPEVCTPKLYSGRLYRRS